MERPELADAFEELKEEYSTLNKKHSISNNVGRPKEEYSTFNIQHPIMWEDGRRKLEGADATKLAQYFQLFKISYSN